MILLLDMDGPLANFDLKVWEICQRNGWDIELDNLEDPRRKRFITDNMRGPDGKALRELINNGDNRWFRDLPVVDGALDGVAELQDYGFDIWVCTKPLEASWSCWSDKALWIREHFPSLHDNLIITPNKGLIKGDVLLDDAIKHSWLPYATWTPVVFPEAFNGAGSRWEGMARWGWGDDPADLETLAKGG